MPVGKLLAVISAGLNGQQLPVRWKEGTREREVVGKQLKEGEAEESTQTISLVDGSCS